MQNTGGKKRAAREDVDSDYLFGNAKKGQEIGIMQPIFSPPLHGPFKSVWCA